MRPEDSGQLLRQTEKPTRDTRLTDLEGDGNLLLCELKVESQPGRHEQPSIEWTHYSFWEVSVGLSSPPPPKVLT